MIESKDTELLTARTAQRKYPKYWNGVYLVNIRVKDSCVYISGLFTSPPSGGLFVNEPIINRTDSKGQTKPKSIDGYVFLIMDQFARSLRGQITYARL